MSGTTAQQTSDPNVTAAAPAAATAAQPAPVAPVAPVTGAPTPTAAKSGPLGFVARAEADLSRVQSTAQSDVQQAESWFKRNAAWIVTVLVVALLLALAWGSFKG